MRDAERRAALLDAVVKAYDIRGTVPDQLDADLAHDVGAAFVEIVDARSSGVVVGRDMRASSPDLAAAFAQGAASRGADVLDIGLASTDLLYFASGRLGRAGAMITASHNPARDNGIKLCRPEAAPVGEDTGLAQLRRLLVTGLPTYEGDAGQVKSRDLLADYATFLRGLVDLRANRQLTVVVDAANGMAGHTVPTVLDGLPLEVVPMYFELDGSFPNHEANPLDPANLVDLQARVRASAADIGLAFDGDADRCFVIDERGEPVSPSAITGMVAARELAAHPGSVVIHNLITSRAVAEVVRENGGIPVRTRVGHSFIKAEMARTQAVFGGEHSAHYYFRDFWNADTGLLAAMHVLAELGRQSEPLSELAAGYQRYVASGEINSRVDDPAARTARVRAAYGDRPGVAVDLLDGLSIDAETWWFNLRPSNTEPLLRLNVEARDAATMERVRDDVLAIVRRTSAGTTPAKES